MVPCQATLCQSGAIRQVTWHNAGMPTHVAPLRGINVGGRNRVAMADLREVVLGLGHTRGRVRSRETQTPR
jgi:hypothetical protein